MLVAKFDPASLLQTRQDERATVISEAPALYNLLNYPEADRLDRSSITKCMVGADKLSVDTKQKLLGFFPNIRGPGDLAAMDDEGFFSVADSQKDLSISGGENIYPREVVFVAELPRNPSGRVLKTEFRSWPSDPPTAPRPGS